MSSFSFLYWALAILVAALAIINLQLNHLCLVQCHIDHLHMPVPYLPQLFILHTHFDLVGHIALALPFYLFSILIF